jgi:lysophospholipase L1-like esterase
MWSTTPRPLRVIKAGDSITYATGSALTNGWRLSFTQALVAGRAVMAVGSDRTASTAFGDLMTGGTGQETDEILALLTVDIPLYRPDLVVIIAGTNDSNHRTAPSGTPPTQAQSVANISSMLDLAQTYGAKVVLGCPLTPNTVGAYDTAIQAQDAAILAMIAAHPWYLAGYVALADLRAAIQSVPSWATAAMDDATHPNDTGYAPMATALSTAALTLI